MILKTYFINFYGIVRKDKIKRSVIINEYGEGGLKISHIQLFYKALKMSWLHKLFDLSTIHHGNYFYQLLLYMVFASRN
jgi:hypothetical protein